MIDEKELSCRLPSAAKSGSPARRAFTLVELMVVIGIIGILSAIMLGVFSGGNESARNARCLSNMRSLAAACQSYAMEHEYYPTAGSVEKKSPHYVNGSLSWIYSENPGWISWNSAGAYVSQPKSSRASGGWMTSTYDSNEDARLFALTNGSLWKYVSGTRDVYRCPSHVKAMRAQKLEPNWSYVMNSFFGYTRAPGNPSDIRGSAYRGNVKYGHLARAERILLFAEMPFAGVGMEPKTSTSPGTECDCVLNYKDKDGADALGFNHKSGKRDYCANVVFADGHAEQLAYPRAGMSDTQLKNLTKWLCSGFDVGLDNGEFDKLTNEEVDEK